MTKEQLDRAIRILDAAGCHEVAIYLAELRDKETHAPPELKL